MRELLLVAVIGIAASCVSAQERPVALVTSVEGTATAFSKANPKGITLGIADVLYAGDRVRSSGGLNLIFCPTANAVVVAPGSEVQFTAKTIELAHGKIVSQRPIPGCRVPVAEIGGPNAHLAGFQMRGDEAMVVLRSPVNVTVPSGEFQLRWMPVESAVVYRLKVQPPDGGTAIEREVRTTEATMNDDSLKPDTSYRWMVTALAPREEILAVSSSHFRTLKAEDAQRLALARRQSDLNETEKHLLVGMLEDQLNMPEQTLADFEAIPEASRSEWLKQQVTALKRRLDPQR